MRKGSQGHIDLTRRAMFAAASPPVLKSELAAAAPMIGPHRFEAWESQRAELERLIDRTPEAEAGLREQLLDRSFALERLIFATPCLDPAAIRVKARLLLWLMEMERADGLAAMRDIYAYLMR